MEKHYGHKFNLNDKCLDYPYAKLAETRTYETLLFEEINQYFRKVIIKNKKVNKAFAMENKILTFKDYNGKQIDNFVWYVTIINDEITFFSNDLYISLDNNKNIKGSEWMTNWKYEEKNNKFLLYYIDKNNVLTLDGNNARLEKENSNKIQQFELFDYIL